MKLPVKESWDAVKVRAAVPWYEEYWWAILLGMLALGGTGYMAYRKGS